MNYRMKQIRSAFLTLALLALWPPSADALGKTPAPAGVGEPLEVKVMSFNIFYWRHWKPFDGPNAWEYRRRMVADTIGDSGADIIGLQEAQFPQVEYLHGRLEDDFGILAMYYDGKTTGMSNALLYRKSRFEVGDWGSFWFSDTPGEPGSKGWGNKYPRLCTWARFVEKETGRSIYIYNAHLDHRSQYSRGRSVELITRRISQRDPKAPFVLTGDLNVEEDNEVIGFLKGEALSLDDRSHENPVPVVDTFRVKHGNEAKEGTFHGFKKDGKRIRIDYIFTGKATKIVDAEIITRHEGDRYPSDHFPITATLRFE